jgi:uncharacterized protein with ATP-grasp and redox domains
MKTYLDCYLCLVRQGLTAVRRAGLSDDDQVEVMNGVLQALQGIRPGQTPPIIATHIHQVIRDKTGIPDPYQELKEQSTQKALALYPRLKEIVATAEDPFETAIRLAIAGNIMDFGPADEYDLWASVERVLAQPLAFDDVAALREAVERADEVLFLSDNAGETVFDRLLIEQIAKPVRYAVKGGPILNDATRADAIAAGIDQAAQIEEIGCNAMGTLLDRCNERFVRLFRTASVIIAKGMAHYESLSTAGPRVFFLLQAKCDVVANDLGVPVKSLIVKQG